MAVYIRPFKAEDINAFEPMEPETNRDEISLIAGTIEDSGLAVTGIKDGKIVACGGVHPNGDKGELWLRLSRDCENYPVMTARFLYEALKIIEKTFGFKQLYAVIQTKFCKSIKLIERFGYKPIRYRTENDVRYIVYSKLIWQDMKYH